MEDMTGQCGNDVDYWTTRRFQGIRIKGESFYWVFKISHGEHSKGLVDSLVRRLL